MSSPNSGTLIPKGKEPAVITSSCAVTLLIPSDNEGYWECDMK